MGLVWPRKVKTNTRMCTKQQRIDDGGRRLDGRQRRVGRYHALCSGGVSVGLKTVDCWQGMSVQPIPEDVCVELHTLTRLSLEALCRLSLMFWCGFVRTP